LRAYKRQPLVEKRFSQFKTDFAVAPVYLQDVARISGLLAVYFFALMAQTLLERELRRAMAAAVRSDRRHVRAAARRGLLSPWKPRRNP
jgi:transposase